MLQALLSLPDRFSDEKKRRHIELEKKLHAALDTGEIIDCPYLDHSCYQNLTIDLSALKNFGGYVARRARKFTCAKSCDICFNCLKAPEDQPLREDDDIIHGRSKGHLVTPSDPMMDILQKVEMAVLEVFQISHLHQDLLFEGKVYDLLLLNN